MENLEILIIEDNLSYALELEMILANWGCKAINIVNNSVDAFRILEKSMTDIILMDITIQGNLNGIEIAEQIRNTGIPIIYMTIQKSEHYYERAKNTNLTSYLIKPFDKLTLKSAIESSVISKIKKDHNTEESPDFFYIRKGKTLKRIPYSDIDLVISDAHYCDLYHNNSKSTTKSSLKKILQQLPCQDFLRVHNRYIVRIAKIEEVLLSKGELLINNMSIPIGRSYKKQLKEKLNLL
jgi:DNA-binding LytR/AlgR family response regulator